MRPVNLIPAEEQRGDRAPMRAGAVAYILIGVLALALVGVVVSALTSKQISDREGEKQHLEVELAAATQRADSLRAFADFRAMQEARTATISSLAQSRFDWERVMRELALIIPSDVWLVNLTGTVTPAVQLEGGAEISVRDTVAGPALELIGCAPSQDSVAAFVASLEDIDGVTRVGVSTSEESEDAQDAAAPSGDQDTTDECRTRAFIKRFELVVAFDAAPVPTGATSAPGVPESLTPAEPGTAPPPDSPTPASATATPAGG